jgi:hypothetical protein
VFGRFSGHHTSFSRVPLAASTIDSWDRLWRPWDRRTRLFTFPTFDFFQSNNGQMAVPASYPDSIANVAQSKLANDYHQPLLAPLADSFSFHHQTPVATDARRDCSFARTSPQFISPFSDSAVTSQPQLLPLYAPKPVRPIPKVCFTPPDDDPLPPHSLLYQPVSKAVRETRFRPLPKPL